MRPGHPSGKGHIQSSDIDHEVIAREVVQYITLSFVSKCQKASQGHGQTSEHRREGGKMGYACESVYRGFLQRPINQKGIMVLSQSAPQYLRGHMLRTTNESA